jgi:hypothetical protein
MTSSASARSVTVRAIGPALSHLQAAAMAPWRETRPDVSRKPVTPQRCEGETIEPSVSVPIENPTRPAAVAEADPAEEPDEPSSGFHGLRVTPPCQTSPYASAPTVVFPNNTAPACSSLSTIVALLAAIRSW